MCLILNNLQNGALHHLPAMLGCFPVPPIRQRQAAGPLNIDPPQFLSHEAVQPVSARSAFPSRGCHMRLNPHWRSKWCAPN
jgi:hypothetical protein